MKSLLLSLVTYIIVLVVVLLGVGFFTLFERKILGYIQVRKGPTVSGYWGLLQPFSDGLKLVVKEQIYPLSSNLMVYFISPVMNLSLSLLCWVVFPFATMMMGFYFSVLFFMACASLSAYSVLSSGWAANSKYSLLGCLRSVAQTISYEVSLALILVGVVFLSGSYDFFDMSDNQNMVAFVFLILPFGVGWLVSGLAETNRSPFDFAEGESELVSGFNVEYGSGSFALLFMAEYGSIILMSSIFIVLMIGLSPLSFLFYVVLSLVIYFFIWVRGTVPRFRYDKLMFMAWKGILPLILMGLGVAGSVLMVF